MTAPNPKDPANLARYLVVGGLAIIILMRLISWIQMLTYFVTAWGLISGILELAAWGAIAYGAWKAFDLIDRLRDRQQ